MLNKFYFRWRLENSSSSFMLNSIKKYFIKSRFWRIMGGGGVGGGGGARILIIHVRLYCFSLNAVA